jgi:hypothetical protein
LDEEDIATILYRSKLGCVAGPAVLCVAWRSVGGRLTGMILSFGYLILRRRLQLIVLGMRRGLAIVYDVAVADLVPLGLVEPALRCG